MYDIPSFNTYCVVCEKDNALFEKREGYEISTICVNCGLLHVRTEKINWRKIPNKGIIDQDSYLSRNPFRKAG